MALLTGVPDTTSVYWEFIASGQVPRRFGVDRDPISRFNVVALASRWQIITFGTMEIIYKGAGRCIVGTWLPGGHKQLLGRALSVCFGDIPWWHLPFYFCFFHRGVSFDVGALLELPLQWLYDCGRCGGILRPRSIGGFSMQLVPRTPSVELCW